MTLTRKTTQTQTSDRFAAYIVNTIIPTYRSGFTLDPATAESPVFEKTHYPDIYYVSKQGHEQCFHEIPSYDQVRRWLNSNSQWMQVPNHFIGFWHHDNRFYLDITKAIVGLKNALSFGRMNHQHSIYHPYSGKTIKVDAAVVSSGAA